MSVCYPTLSMPPNYGMEVVDDDQVIKSPKAAGYLQKRARWTRIRETFTLPYPMMPVKDLNILLAFYKSLNGAAQFFYYNMQEALELEFAWQPHTAYIAGQIVNANTTPPRWPPSGIYARSYVCIVAGTSGAAPPAFTT